MIAVKNSDKVFAIKKWFGVNENADGDANLKMGEASTMTNFKITNDGSLQKRPGTQNVANLLTEYTTDVGAAVTLQTEINASSAAYTMYPTLGISAGGIYTLSGTPATVNASNASTHADYYWQDANGVTYKFKELEYVNHLDATHVTGGWVSIGTGGTLYVGGPPTYYGSLTVSNGVLNLPTTPSSGNYFIWDQYTSPKVYLMTSYIPGELDTLNYSVVTYHADDTWNWQFYPVSLTPSTSDSPIRGIWSGNVGGGEVICAACSGRFWQLTEADGVWTKDNIGDINTDNPVRFFPFGSKLYMLNGTEYKVWDGTDLTTVVGYRPLITVAAPYSGGGTLLQRVNMLNGLRRVQFSPDGSHATFQLPETGLSSIDYVKNTVTGTNYTLTTDYTVNLTNGTVTFGSNPTAGTNTIEIGYTFPTTFRTQIEAMTLSELFNGANDNRVFVYGDGTGTAYYSDLEYETGLATAEYFPDLNTVALGDLNTPILGMVRHYDRLLAFKQDATYSIRYDTLTLVSGLTTAGFYISTINKDIGGTGAILVENHPRSLDGRSLYEWVATTTSGNVTADQRSAQRISQKIEVTLKTLDFTKAITFFDKVNHEFYVVENGTAIVQNMTNGAWYVYRDFPAVCMIVYKDELYFCTADGFLRHVSRDYKHDIGEPITCYWESGSMDFGANFMRKFSDSLWVVLKPESDSDVNVTVMSDQQNTYDTVVADYTGTVATGFFDFLNLNFAHFTFNVNTQPQTQKIKLKVKNFAWYKLIFSSVTNDTTCTVLNTDIKVRYTGNVR